MGKWHSICYALNVGPAKTSGWNINFSVMVLEVGPLVLGSRRQSHHGIECLIRETWEAASYRVWPSWYHGDIIIMTLCLIYNTLFYEGSVVLSLYTQDKHKLSVFLEPWFCSNELSVSLCLISVVVIMLWCLKQIPLPDSFISVSDYFDYFFL